jgi:IclR family mhp operon transcriptional activator
MTTYKPNQSIARGLKILETISSHPGISTPQISAIAEINRTTTYRILETLEELGYVRRRNPDDAYFVTHVITELGQVNDTNQAQYMAVLDAAAPCLRQLNQEIEWPASLIFPDRKTMVIGETTHGRSKKYVHNVGIGTHVPLLSSAAGRAYLSHCSEAKRREILNQVRASNADLSWSQLNLKQFEKTLNDIREKGYALSLGETEKYLSGLAMPILQNQQAVASVNIVFLSGCVNKTEAINKYLPMLRTTIQQIEQRLEAT